MPIIITVTLILGNLAWGLACLSLLLSTGQANFFLGFIGWEIASSPGVYLPLFLIIALGFQLILYYLISSMQTKKRSLQSKYKQERSVNKDLLEQSEQKEAELHEKSKALEKAGTVEEQKNALAEHAAGLEKLTAELRTQLRNTSDEANRVQIALERAEEEIEALKEKNPKPWWKKMLP